MIDTQKLLDEMNDRSREVFRRVVESLDAKLIRKLQLIDERLTRKMGDKQRLASGAKSRPPPSQITAGESRSTGATTGEPSPSILPTCCTPGPNTSVPYTRARAPVSRHPVSDLGNSMAC